MCYILIHNCNSGGKVHGPTLAAIRNNFTEIVKFACETPAPSPPPTPACDEPESDSDDSGDPNAVANRTRSRRGAASGPVAKRTRSSTK